LLHEEWDLLREITRLKEENALLRDKYRWIPVSERLPEEFIPVLLFCSDGYSDVSMRTESDTGDLVFAYSDVTHWMPLPPPPEDV
jgi:hypothetical protein